MLTLFYLTPILSFPLQMLFPPPQLSTQPWRLLALLLAVHLGIAAAYTSMGLLSAPILMRQRLVTRSSSLFRIFSSSSAPSPSSPPPQPFGPPSGVLNLQTVTPADLERLVVSLGSQPYRAKQILHWVRTHGLVDLRHMSNLPASLRTALLPLLPPSLDGPFPETASTPPLPPPLHGGLRIKKELVSARDGTVKRAYLTSDGQVLESVLMLYGSSSSSSSSVRDDLEEEGGRAAFERATACVSSQVGCAMGCVFCASGQMGFSRNLSADEIFEQVSLFDCHLKASSSSSSSSNKKGLTNVVFMGMGEPFLNYRAVSTAIKRMHTELSLPLRRVTISTVGVPNGIRKLADDADLKGVGLAVSLHESDEKRRSDLIPANKMFGGLDELMAAIKYYVDKTNRRVTFEFALIKGKNDTPTTARDLGDLVRRSGLPRHLLHVNVIPLNPTSGYTGGDKSGREEVMTFCDVLDKEFGILATVRVRKGIDIDGGCGQLREEIVKNEQQANASSTPTVGNNM